LPGNNEGGRNIHPGYNKQVVRNIHLCKLPCGTGVQNGRLHIHFVLSQIGMKTPLLKLLLKIG
jgi:hypothetical protein